MHLKLLCFAGLIVLGSTLLPARAALQPGPSDGEPNATTASPEKIRQSTREVFNASEFRHLRRLQEAKENKTADDADEDKASEEKDSGGFDLPMSTLFSNAVGYLFHGLAWLALAVVCGMIVYLIVRAVMTYDRESRSDETIAGGQIEGEADPERAPGELPPDVYVEKARQFAAAGRYRDAIAQLLLGSMAQIERARLIRFRPGLTHYDYLRAARPEERMHRALGSLVRIYEPLGFGRRDATAQHFENSLTRYESGFHATSNSLPA
jgi:hypothetical protein